VEPLAPVPLRPVAPAAPAPDVAPLPAVVPVEPLVPVAWVAGAVDVVVLPLAPVALVGPLEPVAEAPGKTVVVVTSSLLGAVVVCAGLGAGVAAGTGDVAASALTLVGCAAAVVVSFAMRRWRRVWWTGVGVGAAGTVCATAA
jgi:hypothetical protein